MYSIITTKAIVLKSYDSGEKDVTVSLFTRDLGQIYAKVSGIRDIKSKHRYAVQEHSLLDVSLVQGKNGWRITNSNFVKSYYFDVNSEKREARSEKILKILSLVKRFYLGEEANEKVFDDLVSGFVKIDETDDLEKTEAEVVFSFLSDLGYIENGSQVSDISIREMRKAINEGIKISGL